MIGRSFLRNTLPNHPIQRMTTAIPVRGIDGNVVKSDEFITTKIAFEGVDSKGHPVKGVVTAELHVIDDFGANLLVGNDVLVPEDMAVDLGRRRLVIGSCEGLEVPIRVEARKDPHVRRTIRARQAYTIMPGEVAEIPVTWRGRNLPSDRDLLFEPNCPHYLGHEGGPYASVVDASLNKVLVRNTTETPVTLARRVQLGTVTEYNQTGCYLVMPDEGHKATGGWLKGRSWKRQIGATAAMAAAYSAMVTGAMANPPGSTSLSPTGTPSASTTSSTPWSETPPSASDIPQIDPSFEHTLPNGVTVYGNSSTKTHLGDLVHRYQNVFVDSGQTVDIPEKKWMPINLKPGVTPKPNRVYPLGPKNKAVLDDTFDKLHAQEKLHWSTQPTPFSYPAFVV